jgi:hypothetical protein
VTSVSSPPLPTQAGVFITAVGANFGPDSVLGVATIAALNISLSFRYGPYVAANCSVSGVFLVCTSVDGMGAALAVSGSVGNQAFVTNYTLSYTTPQLTDAACVLANGTQSPVLPTTGCTVVLTGTNFGPAVPSNQASLALSVSGLPTIYVPASACTMTTPHSVVRCSVGPGAGAFYALNFSVATAVAIVQTGVLSFAPPAPAVFVGNSPMSTLGGESITVQGTSFGPAGTLVSVFYTDTNLGTRYNAACQVQSDTAIACQTVPGVGAQLRWTVTVALQATVAPFYTRYQRPVVTGITCSPTLLDTRGGSQCSVQGARVVLHLLR